MDAVAALGLGAVVGLGVAMPLGAIGVLLLRTAVERGLRVAAAAGLGVASVDLVYALVAVLAGSAVAGALEGHEWPVRVSAAVLAAVAVVGLVRSWRVRPSAPGYARARGRRSRWRGTASSGCSRSPSRCAEPLSRRAR